MGKAIEHANNSEFLGDLSKFKYLAIHGYERWQVDKDGKLRDGKSSEWIKDYCRKDSDPDYMNLTIVQRYTLDAMRRLTGLHGKWCPNDLMWVSRATCAAPKERMYVTHAVLVLVLRGLVSLSNVQLGSREGVDQSREDNSAVQSGTERSDHTDEDLEAKSKAAPKAKPSVPKFEGKISVKPVIPATLTPEMEEFAGSLSAQWQLYKLPDADDNIATWSGLILKHLSTNTVKDVPDVMAWMMFISDYWKPRIHSVKDFARCFPTMLEQYIKCGGDDLAPALEFASKKYADELNGVSGVPLKNRAPANYGGGGVVPLRGPKLLGRCLGCGNEESLNANDLCMTCSDESLSFKVEDVEISDTDGLEA